MLFCLHSIAMSQGQVFDYLGLVIAVLTIVQLVWSLFVRA
jgi:hypothetical protein